MSGKDMTHGAEERPRKFLERLPRTYGLLSSVQCRFLLVGREDTGGAQKEWDVGVRQAGERGGGWATSSPGAEELADGEGPPGVASALQSEVPHIWFAYKGKSQRVSGREETQQTRPS